MCIALVVRHKCFHSVFSSLEAIHQDDDGEQLMSASSNAYYDTVCIQLDSLQLMIAFCGISLL